MLQPISLDGLRGSIGSGRRKFKGRSTPRNRGIVLFKSVTAALQHRHNALQGHATEVRWLSLSMGARIAHAQSAAARVAWVAGAALFLFGRGYAISKSSCASASAS